jgi:hypothetical protein
VTIDRPIIQMPRITLVLPVGLRLRLERGDGDTITYRVLDAQGYTQVRGTFANATEAWDGLRETCHPDRIINLRDWLRAT